MGASKTGRNYVVSQALNNTLSLIQGSWKYIEPSKGPKISKNTNTELGNDVNPQLYNLETDPGETRNVATAHPQVVTKLAEQLKTIAGKTTSR